MWRTSVPLQTLPSLSAEGSMLHQNQKNQKRRFLKGPGEGLEVECTPTELTQRCPPHKHQRLLRDKENQQEQFVIARRSRRTRDTATGLSWEGLPDELLLKILFCLSLQDLLKMASVCRRWHRLVFDESLWHSVDLEGLSRVAPALQQVLRSGVRRLRSPRVYIDELHFSSSGPLQLVQMDLSSSIIPVSALESIVSSCEHLQDLSLEGLRLSDRVVQLLSTNRHLEQLNVSGCSGFSAAALSELLMSCQRILQLNISWCDFTNEHVRSMVHHLSPRVTHLNLSGYRENLTLDDVKVLVSRCLHIHTLDLSDSTLLMADSFPVLSQLRSLQHLSLSRCYHIHPAALSDLSVSLTSLSVLDVFGLITEAHLPGLKKDLPHVSINSRPFSAVARPSPASRGLCNHGDSLMWSRRCRLRVRL